MKAAELANRLNARRTGPGVDGWPSARRTMIAHRRPVFEREQTAAAAGTT
jgi:hypothetical protein